MNSRSLLGCQHPYLLVLGLALTLLHSIPGAEAGASPVRLIVESPAMELVPEFKACYDDCVSVPTSADHRMTFLNLAGHEHTAYLGNHCLFECEPVLSTDDKAAITKMSTASYKNIETIYAEMASWANANPEVRHARLAKAIEKAQAEYEKSKASQFRQGRRRV